MHGSRSAAPSRHWQRAQVPAWVTTRPWRTAPFHCPRPCSNSCAACPTRPGPNGRGWSLRTWPPGCAGVSGGAKRGCAMAPLCSHLRRPSTSRRKKTRTPGTSWRATTMKTPNQPCLCTNGPTPNSPGLSAPGPPAHAPGSRCTGCCVLPRQARTPHGWAVGAPRPCCWPPPT